jgi:dsDNA-binding SOS-regulon protein
MSNLSYCRMQNTLKDFRDVVNHVKYEWVSDLEDEEAQAYEKILELAKELIELSE